MTSDGDVGPAVEPGKSSGAGSGVAEWEDALRGMLTRRAEQVQTGATWHAPEGGQGRRAGLRSVGRVPVRRWMLPVAAAAVVVALVVTVITLRGPGSPADDASPGPVDSATPTSGSGTPGGTGGGAAPESLASAPAPIAQQPIPEGMQAVDALGVEIFVPASLTVDPPCDGHSVSRPAYGLTYAIGCIPLALPAVWFATGTAPPTWNDAPPSTCANSVRLEDESGCLTIEDSSADPQVNTDPEAVTATIIWPRHNVAIIAEFPSGQRKRALAVVESAHWVPVDRHGCAVTRSPVVPANAASLPEGPVLPADATSTSLCWYSGGRLVASATLPSTGATASLEHPGAPGNAPGIGAPPSYSPSPDGPACGDLGHGYGVVFQSTRSDGSIAVSAAQFADCTGGQFWTDGTHAQPVDEALASAIRGLTGFLLVFGYQAISLDPETSDVAPATANDLPATVTDLPATSTTPGTTAASSGAAAPSSPVTGESVTGQSVTGESVTEGPTATGSVTATSSAADGPVPTTLVTDVSTDRGSGAGPAQLPVPDGMQAVDALGVEIFVPRDLPLDPGACSTESGVSRPVPHLPYGAQCAPTLQPRAARIFLPKAGEPAADATSCGTFTVPLDGETACAVVIPATNGPTSYSIAWPQHDVAITAEDPDPRVTEQILRSAHPVPVDRNGCAATRSPMRPANAGVPPAFPYPILATGATSLSVCWYLGNRLGASALLDSAASATVIDAVNSGTALWPAPADRPTLTPCTTVEQHDGVLLAAHLPGGRTAQAVGIFAACDGQQTIGNDAGAVLATPDLVSVIAAAAGLEHALALDYPYASS